MIFRCCPLAAAGWGHLTKRSAAGLKGSQYIRASQVSVDHGLNCLFLYIGGTAVNIDRCINGVGPEEAGGWTLGSRSQRHAGWWSRNGPQTVLSSLRIHSILFQLPPNEHWTCVASKQFYLERCFLFLYHLELQTLTFLLHSKPSREHLLIWNTADCSADGNPLKKPRPFCWKSAPAVKTNWPTVGLLRCMLSTDTAPQIFLNSTQSLCIAQKHTRCRLHIASVHGARASTPRGANGCTTWPQPSLPCPVDIRPVHLMMMIVITTAHNYIITLPHWHRNIYRNRTLSLALIYKVGWTP